jgi:hypothetical protein
VIDGFGLGSLASLFYPGLDFSEIPHNATRRQVEALRELASPLHVVDRGVRERNYLT